jgi:hypothetical protein
MRTQSLFSIAQLGLVAVQLDKFKNELHETDISKSLLRLISNRKYLLQINGHRLNILWRFLYRDTVLTNKGEGEDASDRTLKPFML